MPEKAKPLFFKDIKNRFYNASRQAKIDMIKAFNTPQAEVEANVYRQDKPLILTPEDE